MSIFAVLPAYNEGKTLEEQLKAVCETLDREGRDYRLIIIDDGSQDETARVLEKAQQKMPLTVIHHERNRGCGAAFRSGFNEVLRHVQDEDVVLTLEADNTQNVRSIRMMLQKMEEGYEVVVGSYFAPGGMLIGAPFIRYICSRLSNRLYHLLFPIRGVTVYTGFFRGYQGRAFKQAYAHYGESWLDADGFTVMAAFLLKLRRMPLFITEVPLIVRYDCKIGKSKMKLVPTILGHLQVIAREMFQRRIF